jgi:type I restriction enzyme M protein
MQQVFMSFVPAVFKKSLDQYFTPIELVKVMVQMVRIGPNDKIADPGMGTADFLTAAAEQRASAGDQDILQRIYGMDSDAKAFDLAVVNMILNKDGQSNLLLDDSIENYDRFAAEMGIVLCNPPFGEKSIEGRNSVLKNYDLGHEWEQDKDTCHWKKTDRILPHQQLGLLFLECCFKLLDDKGRLAIILP